MAARMTSQVKAYQVPWLVVRRIPANAAAKKAAGQDGLFDAWHFHAFFATTDLDQGAPWQRTRPTALTRSSRTSMPT